MNPIERIFDILQAKGGDDYVSERVTQLQHALRSAHLAEVALVPGTGGVFEVSCDGKIIWERKRDGGFPDAAKLKQLVRDVIDPERDLGHADRNLKGG